MKLHEALRAVLKKSGFSVLDDRRFLSFLADYKAYEDYPAMKQVMKALADCGYAREFSCRIRNRNDCDISLYMAYLKRTLSEAFGFKQEFACYAADSIAYALELTDTVNEPADHGYDAVDRKAVHNKGCIEHYDIAVSQDKEHTIHHENDSSVLCYLQEKAEEGDASAQKILGDMHLEGDIVGKDYVQAVKWYRKAAELGNSDAQFCLGRMYLEGWGTGEKESFSDSRLWKNYAEAEKWQLKAARHGNAFAMRELARMYGFKSKIAEIDGEYDKGSKYMQKSDMWHKKSVDGFKILAEHGNPWAMCQLVMVYAIGDSMIGIKRNSSESHKWSIKCQEVCNKNKTKSGEYKPRALDILNWLK